MSKYLEGFMALNSNQQAEFTVAAVFAVIFVVASLVLFYKAKKHGVSLFIGGVASLVFGGIIIFFLGTAIAPEGSDEAYAASASITPVIDIGENTETVDLVYRGGGAVVEMSDDGELTVDENGYIPDVRISRDLQEAKYAWINPRIDLSYYSANDRVRMVTTKCSTGEGDPKKGYEISDAVDDPMWFDSWEVMKQWNLADVNNTEAKITVTPITDVDSKWLDEYMEKSYNEFKEKSADEEELAVRTTLTIDLFHKLADLDDHLRAMTEVPAAIKNNQWIEDEWIPMVDSWFEPDEDGNILGYAAAYEYVPGHEGQSGWYQMKDEIRVYAGYAANMLELSTYRGCKRIESKIHWPLDTSGNDDERRIYREDDPKKQIAQLAYIFTYQDKNSKETGNYGVDKHDRRREIFKPNVAKQTEVKADKPAGTTQTTVITTSTSSDGGGQPDGGTTPDDTSKKRKKHEDGKDKSESSNYNPDNDQGTGKNNPSMGKGKAEDLAAAEKAAQEAAEKAAAEKAAREAAEKAAAEKAAQEAAEKAAREAAEKAAQEEGLNKGTDNVDTTKKDDGTTPTDTKDDDTSYSGGDTGNEQANGNVDKNF